MTIASQNRSSVLKKVIFSARLANRSRRMTSSVMIRCTRSFFSFGRLREQCPHADQIERRRGEDERPVDARAVPVPPLAQPADGLDPAEALLDQLPFLLTDRVAQMAGCADIDRAAATRGLGMLGHVRGDAQRAELLRRPFRVLALVAAERHATGIWQVRTVAPAASRSAVPVAWVRSASIIKPWRFSMSTCQRYASFASCPRGFLVQPRVRIRGRLIASFALLLAWKCWSFSRIGSAPFVSGSISTARSRCRSLGSHFSALW